MGPERRALVLSAAAALLVGIVALVAGLRAGSAAILLDAAFNLCFFVTALVTLRIAELLQRPDDRRFPFGYLQFEPLINLVKGLLILGVGLIALIDAGLAIGRGGTTVSSGLALGYAVFGTMACGATLIALRRAHARAPSPLLRGDVENWTVNLVITAGMAVAFVLAMQFERRGMPGAAKLVDPALVALVVLLTAAVPIRMAGQALGALLLRAPDPALVGSIEALVRRALGDLPLRALYVRASQPGRTIYAMVHVLVENEAAGLQVAQADALRQSAVAAVAGRHAPVILDIVFTGVEDFAAPTTGFVAGSPAGGPVNV